MPSGMGWEKKNRKNNMITLSGKPMKKNKASKLHRCKVSTGLEAKEMWCDAGCTALTAEVSSSRTLNGAGCTTLTADVSTSRTLGAGCTTLTAMDL